MTVITAAKLREEAARAREIAEQLARDAAAATAAELEASRPKCPTLEDGESAILGFERYQSGRAYVYAAVVFRQGRNIRVAVTGNEARRFNWAGFLSFVGEANWPTLFLMNMGHPLLPPGAEPPVAERMGRYGRVLDTQTVDTVTPFTQGGYS